MNARESESKSLDSFHRGRFWLTQPAGRGHRAGMDAMVLAAAVPSGFSGSIADLGSGAGAAGFAVAARCEHAEVTLIERDPVMVGYAGASVALDENRHLQDRICVQQVDVSLAGRARVEAGLADRAYDFAVMNPPFNKGTDRQSPDELKREAHVMQEGMLEAWIRTSAAIVRPGGALAMIARPASLAAILTSCDKRFGALELKPVLPEKNQTAIRIVARGVRGSRAGLSVHPPLVLHDGERRGFSAEADAICNGRSSLFGD